MFIGEYRHNLDAKNRIIIPSKYRDELGATFIVTLGLDGCLTIYSYEQWSRLLEELKKLPDTKKESRMYRRLIIAKASECELDKQGRIQLPSHLVKGAQMQKECVVVGVSEHVEIWALETWNAFYEEASASFEDIAEKLTDFMV
ncbi:MAG: division/cell wall cluster transcriptional repressor MraZ [Erysipelotrichaceae bacterium]